MSCIGEYQFWESGYSGLNVFLHGHSGRFADVGRLLQLFDYMYLLVLSISLGFRCQFFKKI